MVTKTVRDVGRHNEDEQERHLISRLVPVTACVEIMEAALREGIAIIFCWNMNESFRDHLCQARQRCQQQGDHRFDDLSMREHHTVLVIYPKPSRASNSKDGAQFFLTVDGIVRC